MIELLINASEFFRWSMTPYYNSLGPFATILLFLIPAVIIAVKVDQYKMIAMTTWLFFCMLICGPLFGTQSLYILMIIASILMTPLFLYTLFKKQYNY